jgi:hypothetical protein
MKKAKLRRLAVVAATALVAAIVFSSAIHAAPNRTPLLDLTVDWPQIVFDNTGQTNYVAAQQLLEIDADALFLQFEEDGPPFLIQAIPGDPRLNGTFKIRAVVDHAGGLVGGIGPGDTNDACGGGNDFCVTGVLLDGVFNGVLLTGEVVNFKFADGGTSPDQFEFHIKITGGALEALYPTGHIVVPVTSEMLPGASPFNGADSFNADFGARAKGTAGSTDRFMVPLPPPPPVVSGIDVIAEATGPAGAVVSFAAGATDSNGAILPVTCSPASGSVFGLGQTPVVCTSGPDRFGQTGRGTLSVKVQDTTPPTIIGSNVEVEADGPHGHSSVPLPVTAIDLVDGVVAVVCDPASGSPFPIGSTPVMCTAIDAVHNLATRINVGAPELAAYIIVTVKENPPALPGGACFVVNFREITYFKGQSVITSWPYRPGGGVDYTKSRGTQFRIYGFQPAQLGQLIPNVDNTWTTYPVRYDNEVRGYYIDLGGPARVMICPDQLHEYVLAGKKGNGHMEGSTLLPLSQQNVPGIMLTHNTQIVKLPYRVRKELYQLGLFQAARGVIDYIGFQLQGSGSPEFREFVDVEVQFAGDSQTDRLKHYQVGFHTAVNTNFETFAGCNYVDYAPGNDAVRLRDVWGPNRSNRQGYAIWQACASREPAVNQRQRANYEVPFNGVQILPTVNTSTDTLRLFYGVIRPIPESETRKKDHKTDWAEWDRWDY